MNKSEFQTLRAELGLCENISINRPDAYVKLSELFKKNPIAGDGIIEQRRQRPGRDRRVPVHAPRVGTLPRIRRYLGRCLDSRLIHARLLIDRMIVG